MVTSTPIKTLDMGGIFEAERRDIVVRFHRLSAGGAHDDSCDSREQERDGEEQPIHLIIQPHPVQ